MVLTFRHKDNLMQTDQKPIVGAILLAGAMIAGAILLRGSAAPLPAGGIPTSALPPISDTDQTLGNPKAKIALVIYEDYQCPFCAAVSGLDEDAEAVKYLRENVDPNWQPFMPEVNKYVAEGKMLFVFRDFPFLGPESIQAAEAARCAGEQDNYWQYHDYLYTHQDGENKGAFADNNLKAFAKTLGLNTESFNECLDSNKYEQAIFDSRNGGKQAGVEGTPRGFILKNGKVVDTIDGAESLEMVKPKLEAAFK